MLLDNGPCHRTMARVREREANLLSTYFQHNGSTAGKSLAPVARAQVSMTVLLPAVGHLDEYICLPASSGMGDGAAGSRVTVRVRLG